MSSSSSHHPSNVVVGHGASNGLDGANGGRVEKGGVDVASLASPPVAGGALRCVSSGPPAVVTGGLASPTNSNGHDDDAAVIAAPPDATAAATTAAEDRNARKIEDDEDETDAARTGSATVPAAGNSGGLPDSEVMNGPRASGDDDEEADKDAQGDGDEEMGGEGAEEEEDEDEDDEYEYEYEDDDEAAYSGFLVDSGHGASLVASESQDVGAAAPEPARIEDEVVSVAESSRSKPFSEDSPSNEPRKKWREPSRAAVNMSLRAQKETTGSKRRLAQDLYRIMNQGTEEAGFSLTPQSEDSMDKWCIKLFQFDEDSNLAKDMMVLNIDHIELEMSFPDQYPFEPPFVRVVRPRFKRQTGFVMAGALCMELLTSEGWNPINDIESVIVSIRSLLVVGDGRLQAASELPKAKYDALLAASNGKTKSSDEAQRKRQKLDSDIKPPPKDAGAYTANEAKAAYTHLSDYHKKKGWDNSGWWARKG